MLQYTSYETARELIEAAALDSPTTVVDFCAGNGSLLRAARKRWPNARLFANDIDDTVVRSVEDVIWVTSDFLKAEFDSTLPSGFPDQFDLIVLNPPFSFDRTLQWRARGSLSKIDCSVAFSFLFTALGYLSHGGELLAVMPTSTLQSDRDKEARGWLRKNFNCRMISEPSYDRFSGLDVSTYLMALRRKTSSFDVENLSNSRSGISTGWTISRGRISVKRSNRIEQCGLHGWIHTTSIKLSKIVIRYELPQHCSVKDQKFVAKNSLIVPRVGKVRRGDLVLSTRKEILSDCLLGITFDDASIALRLLNCINQNFNSLTEIYAGTGAPYTTRLKLSHFIEHLLANDKVLAKRMPGK